LPDFYLLQKREKEKHSKQGKGNKEMICLFFQSAEQKEKMKQKSAKKEVRNKILRGNRCGKNFSNKPPKSCQ